MPRNPNKRRCTFPKCRAWAMRGHHFCRSHRDHELGPRGAGAPKGNLNAFKTGEYATLPEMPALNKIALEIARHPEQLPAQIAQITHDIESITHDTAKTLEVLRRIIPNLIPEIHDSIFLVELERELPNFPAYFRARFLNILYKTALPMSPEDRVRLLRELVNRLQKIQFPEEQLTEND